MDSRAQEGVPDPQGGVAARLFGVLSEFIAPEFLSFGGGTVLAARWRHRRSLDVDLFCGPSAYDGLGLTGRERLEAAIRAIPGCAEEATLCDSIAAYVEIDGLEATLLPRTTVIESARPTRLAGTRLALQSSAQILYAKIARRMYASGEIAVRDAYDLACARRFDLSALQCALGNIDPREVHVVREIIRTIPVGRLIDDEVKPVIEPCFEWTGETLKEVVLEALRVPPAPRDMSPPENDRGNNGPGP